ncbi:MAG: DUF4956 domain-containing protein [Bacteroidales bacterium]|nr:DUF4956 domain-containing protein [Bacteroidales bacterium]
MEKYKIFLLVITFLIFIVPGSAVFSQDVFSSDTTSSGLVQQTDENVVKDKKKDKKKDKDEVQINETFFVSLLIDLIAVIIIVVFIYYPNYKKQEVFFTYFLFNIAIFLLTFLLNKIKISMGAAFGLFAVFSMLRYRTEGISMKDMTYLFVVIAIGLVSAVQLEYYELVIINAVLIVSVFALDGNVIIRREYSKMIQYENIEMIKPENHPKLIADLKTRTGLDIHRISISRIDFLRDMATIDVFYFSRKRKKSGVNDVEVNYDDKPVE